jgi:hypothetical protein
MDLREGSKIPKIHHHHHPPFHHYHSIAAAAAGPKYILGQSINDSMQFQFNQIYMVPIQSNIYMVMRSLRISTLDEQISNNRNVNNA